MTPDVVVDVGNSALKWGLCRAIQIEKMVSLPFADETAWQHQLENWQLHAGDTKWVIAGVQPAERERFRSWLTSRGEQVRDLTSFRQLPLSISLAEPEKVGIDRLLDAVAANSRRPPQRPAVVIDAGSAVTVDWIDEAGSFRGGAILPGFRLMAQSLHDYTAKLPTVDPPKSPPAVPGLATRPAIELGVYWAVAGGLRALLDAYQQRFVAEPIVFLTGGDSPALLEALPATVRHWPTMTLEGIRLTAESWP